MPRAGVAQLAERQPSKLHVAGSIPVSRSNFPASCSTRAHRRTEGRSSRPGPGPWPGAASRPAGHDRQVARGAPRRTRVARFPWHSWEPGSARTANVTSTRVSANTTSGPTIRPSADWPDAHATSVTSAMNDFVSGPICWPGSMSHSARPIPGGTTSDGLQTAAVHHPPDPVRRFERDDVDAVVARCHELRLSRPAGRRGSSRPSGGRPPRQGCVGRRCLAARPRAASAASSSPPGRSRSSGPKVNGPPQV